MKNPSLAYGGARSTLGFVVTAWVSLQVTWAQDLTKIHIQQNQADQQEVRQNTADVVAQVQSLIDELAANGISGDDAKVIMATKAALANLSGPEMERVITSLQKASETPDTKIGQQNVVAAYAGQKAIILQFSQILEEYEQRQAAFELPARFKDLADRQTETMWTTAKVAASAIGKSSTQLTTMQQTTEQIVQADQGALANELALAQQQLDKAVPGSTGDEGNALQKAQQDLKDGKLQNALDQASEDLKAGRLLKATTDQKIARDALQRVTKDLNPVTDAVSALSATGADLAKVIADQKSLLNQTNAAAEVKSLITGLDEKQGILVDKTNSLQQDMLSMSPAAAAAVRDAITPMQESRADLGPRGGLFTKAAASQEEAIAQLEEAQKQLQQQVADAQKAAGDAAKDPVAALQDLKKQILAAIQAQQQIMGQTGMVSQASPPDTTGTAQNQQQQRLLQQQTTGLQQAAQPVSLPASQSLADAATHMTQAQQAIPDPARAPDTAADQKAALGSLVLASQQIDQEIAKNEAATADPAALAAAANALQDAQDSVSSAIADSSSPSSSPTSSPTSSPSSAPSLADAKAALNAAAAETGTAGATPGLPTAAAAAVADAKSNIAKGQSAADKGDAKGTSAAAAAAQSALASAQASVAVAQAGMAPGSGPPLPRMASTTPPPPGHDKPSLDGAKIVSGGSTDKGTMHDVDGTGRFTTVAFRDRAAVDQTQSEKRPQEYAPMIDQYMKNLADQSSASSP